MPVCWCWRINGGLHNSRYLTLLFDGHNKVIIFWCRNTAIVLAHRLYFPEHYYPELKALSGTRGAYSILKNHTSRVIQQPFPEAEFDLDKPEDLNQINQYQDKQFQAKQGTAL